MQITKKKQVCLLVVLGILTLVAMCFLKEAQNDPKRYSNGKIVKMEEKYGRCILETATGSAGCKSKNILKGCCRNLL